MSAKKTYERYGGCPQPFKAAICLDDEEFEMLVRGEIELVDESIDAMIALGFNIDWIRGNGDPYKPEFDKRGT